MTNFDDIMARYANDPTVSATPIPVPTPAAKQADVASASAQKKQSILPSYNLAAARDTGAGGSMITDPVQRDAVELNNWELLQKYGPAAGDIIASNASADAQYYGDKNAFVSSPALDFGKSVGVGAVNSILGIGALGLGLVSDKAGTWAAEGLDKFNQWEANKQSAGLANRRRANAAINELGFGDNKAQYEQDKQNDGTVIASLKRFGRDAFTAGSNILEDPYLTNDLVGNAAGSLLTAGPTSGALKAIGKAALGAAVKRGAIAEGGVVASKLASAGSKAVTPTAIGLQEGGGAYQQAVMDAWESLKDRTDLTEDQKTSLANRAGLMAAAIQTPAAALTGTLVSKFEEAPFKVGNLGRAVGNIGKEAVEEGLQSGSGQLAQNIGVKEFADQNRDITDGVGEQIGLGALGGSMSAGMVQAPRTTLSLTAKGAVAAGKTTMRGITAAGNALLSRGDKIIAENEAASPVSPETLRTNIDAVAAEAPQAVQTAAQDIQNSDAAPEQKQEATDYLNNFVSKIGFAPEQYFDDSTPEPIRTSMDGVSDKFEAMQRLADTVENTDEKDPSHMMAGLYLYDMINENRDLAFKQLPEVLAKLPKDHPAFQALDSVNQAVAGIEKTPKVSRALNVIQKMMAQATVTPEQIDSKLETPEGNNLVKTAIGISEVAPQNANPETNDRILYHAAQGKINLTPVQKATLEASSELVRQAADYQSKGKDWNLPEVDAVSRELHTKDGDQEATDKSTLKHTQGVLDAYRAGNWDLASERLNDFLKFAQHMQNKVGAINEHLINGNGDVSKAVKYQLLTPSRKFVKSAKGLWVRPDKARSVAGVQRIGLDAEIVGKMANKLTEIFPDLNQKAIDLVPLDQSLTGPAEEVAKRFTEAQNKPTEKPAKPKSEEAPASEPEPVVEEKTAPEAPEPVAEPEPKVEEPKVEEKQPEPEVKSEPEAETEKPEPTYRTKVEVFPHLFGGVNNQFKKAFRFAKEAKSRTTGVENPLEFIRDAFRSPSALNNLNPNIQHNITPEITRDYMKLFSVADTIKKTMEKNLQAFVSKPSVAKAIAENQSVDRWVAGKAISIAEDVDGKLSYNSELLENAVLAGLQWMLSADQYKSELDNEDIQNLTGVPADQIRDDKVARLQTGMSALEIKQTLAQKIAKFWGMDRNPDAAIGYTDGIPEAVAAEIVRAMIETGGITVDTVQLDESDGLAPNTFKSFNRYDVRTDLLSDNLFAYPSAIEEAVLVDPEPVNYIGSAPTKVAKTQMRNPLVENTELDRQAIANEQNTPHYANMPMVNFLTSIGMDNVLALFGSGDLSDKNRFNKNHLKSLEGKNITIASAYKSLMRVMNEVQNRAKADGVEPDQMPIHYAYNMSRVNRMQMLGIGNPQANKLVREAILPTRSTLDLNGPDRSAFLLGLAQALGVKVHTISRAESEKTILDKLKTDFAGSVDILRNYLKDGKTKFGEAEVQTMKKELGSDLTPMGLHALMEYARVLNTDVEGRKVFTTSVYVEADGVTNGPINAMVLMSAGRFATDWVRNVAKGGLFFGRPDKTMNDHRSEDKNDLYQTVTNNLVRALGTTNFSGEIAGMSNEFFKLMNLFNPDVSFENGQLQFKRGIAKNPLTITIYGSGAKGIAGNVVDALTTSIYERMSAAQQRQMDNKGMSIAQAMFPESADPEALLKEFDRSVAALLGSQLRRVQGELTMVDTGLGEKNGTLREYTFNQKEMNILQDNVLHLFINPLRDAIESTVGSQLMESVGTIQKATQVQGIVLQYAFEREVAKALENKAKNDPNWKQGDFLSTADLSAIMKRLNFLSPLIETGSQRFMIAGSQATDAGLVEKNEARKAEGKKPLANEFSRGFDDSLRTPAQIYGPRDPGVAGIPFLTIGMGDGRMMQLLATMKNAPENTLKIFDGMNMKLSSIEEDAVKANQAVFESWMGNPVAEVAKSFESFIKSAELNQLDGQQLKDLSRALLGPKAPPSKEAVQGAIKELYATVQRQAREVEARHKVMARVNLSIDQMAAVGKAYQNQGEIDLSDLNDEQLVAKLNELFDEELAKTEPKKTSQKIESDLETVGRVHSTGVRVISNNQLKNLVRKLNIPAEQKEVLKDILKSLAAKDFTVISGTTEQMRDYALINDPDVAANISASNVNGMINFGTKTLYIGNVSSETLTHELIHAATYDRVFAYYNGENLGPNATEQVKAIERMETLMDQFMSMEDDLSEMNEQTRTAYKNARIAILNERNNNNPAGALNEFMAWSLSNTNLIRLQKQTVIDRLAQIAQDVWQGIKRLVWGKKYPPKVATDMHSNLRFNANVLMRTQATAQQMFRDGMLYQSTAYGNSDRLTQINETFDRQIVSYIRQNPIDNQNEFNDALAVAVRSAVSAMAGGFNMNMQELTTFKSVVAALATQAKLDPNALARAQELYKHVVKNLTVEDFMPEGMLPDAPQRYFAQMKYNVVLGTNITGKDNLGRSTLLPVFLGLALVSDEFRSILQKMETPKIAKIGSGTVDEMVSSAGTYAMDQLSAVMSGDRNTKNIRDAIDGLTNQIIDIAQDRQNFIEQQSGKLSNGIDKLNAMMVEQMAKTSDKVIAKAQEVQQASNNKFVKSMATFTEGLASLVTEKNGKNFARGVMSGMNRMNLWQPFYDVVNDLVGRTDTNGPIYDMIKRVRSLVQQTRQQFREYLPTIIEQQFSNGLTDEQQSSLYRGLGKADIAALANGMTLNQIDSLISDPTARTQAIDTLEAEIREMDTESQLIFDKSKQLANYMNTGIPGVNLLRNATAVAHLFGESRLRKPSTALIQKVDHLVSLYAFEGLNQNDKDAITQLVQDEPKGMEFVVSYLIGQRKDEMDKANGLARMNHYKGFIPTQAAEGVNLIVADDSDYAKLTEKSYVRVGSYKGSNLDRFASNRGYYYAPVSGRAPFNQGILQNVRQTAGGIDLSTGYSHDVMTAGRITDPAAVRRINAQLRRETAASNEHLMPLYDSTGNIYAFERSLDPNQVARLQQDTTLTKQIGIWRGRQVEEGLANRFNQTLIDRLKEVYDNDIKDSASNKAEYVNLFGRQTDPVLADAVKLINPETRAYIESQFGEQFFVRKDMLNDVLGYRSASIGDVWTENSRWPDHILNNIKRTAIGIFGNDAYAKMTNAEKTLQNFVSDARVMIVVKSVVVPVSNVIANIYSLSARGVPLLYTLRQMPKKTAEIENYVRTRLRQIDAEAELRAANGDLRKERQLRSEIQSISDAHRRLSIWPLIEAGEFSAVSDNVSREDIDLTSGKLHQYVENLVQKLPEQVRTAGRYAMITRDTALFQGLQKAVEYGDFIAKAVLYDDITGRQKKTSEEALAAITEEFVNYDRLSGRFRQYLESTGLLWFYNFKIRSAKIAVSMIRNNPLHALLTSLAPVPSIFGSVGTPISDNFFTLAAQGNLTYSVGPGMGLRAPTLNPWVNILS